MGKLNEIIPISKDEMELYLDYDYKYFQGRVFEQDNVSKQNKEIVTKSYIRTRNDLKIKIRDNKKQTLLFLDGAIRKMHSGGLLPSLFNLSEAREVTIIDYEGEGQAHAYFEVWRKYRKRRLMLQKFWDSTVKIGAVLGIVLTVLKVIEVLKK